MLYYPGAVYRKVVHLPWEPWFAWRPVKIHGRRVWLQTVYRRATLKYIDTAKWQHVEYGTLFDVIQRPEK